MVRDDGTGCVGSICGGKSISINNFSARKNANGQWEITSLPGSGSGGSGGGGGGSASIPPQNDLDVEDRVGDAIAEAASAIPNAGSVTQSSNVDSNGVTIDQVEVTVEYGASQNRFSVTNGADWSIDTDEGYEKTIAGGAGGAGGTLNVDVFSDIEAPTVVSTPGETVRLDSIAVDTPLSVSLDTLNARDGLGTLDGVSGRFHCDRAGGDTCPVRLIVADGVAGTNFSETDWMFTPSTGTTTESPDTDYLAVGFWLFVPDDETSADDYVFGAFADGNDPFEQSNLMALTGTATYDGDAIGAYSEETNGDTVIGEFDGDVSLTAYFGAADALGTISGSITNFNVDEEPETGRLNLGSAEIGSVNNGFFQGAVTGSDDEHTYTGRWGGQFFGNEEADGMPGSVAGTFGGTSDDDTVNFVGAFGAHKQ